MKLILQKLNVSLYWLLISITVFSGCAFNGKAQGIAFDHRDYVEVPVGTVIKNVPFYVNGSTNPPVLMDYTTSSEGAFFSMEAQQVLKK